MKQKQDAGRRTQGRKEAGKPRAAITVIASGLYRRTSQSQDEVGRAQLSRRMPSPSHRRLVEGGDSAVAKCAMRSGGT